MSAVGSRVGCMLSASADGKTVFFLGYGVYSGNEIPFGAVGPLADKCISLEKQNPKLTLDSGKVVWGCECWWGSEDEVKKSIAGKTLVPVDIEEIRSQYAPRRWFDPED